MVRARWPRFPPKQSSKSADHLPEPPKLWILCGGGRKNPHIVNDLREGAEKSGR